MCYASIRKEAATAASTTIHGRTLPIVNKASAAAATRRSDAEWIAVLQTGRKKAAANTPRTPALMPGRVVRRARESRIRDQKESAAVMARRPGRKIAISATKPRATREWLGWIAAPRKAANVNSGPGRAWAKP